MKAILQRVSSASVAVDGRIVGEIGTGLMVLCGFGAADDESKLKPMAEKLVNMRVFPDERGRFDRSLLEIKGELLLVPQFTLFADTSKGRRPEFFGAMPPERATLFFDQFVTTCTQLGTLKVAAGVFGAHMQVSLCNDGPVTISLEY